MIEIIDIRQLEFSEWAELYKSYAEFYKVPISEEQLHVVWEWLGGHETELKGIAALADGKPAGIVHYRRFLRPLVGEVGIFLDDIFVCPTARRKGVGKVMIEAIENIAKNQNCSIIRWITADYNRDAQTFYDQFGKKTGWITYDHVMSDDKDGHDRK